ncbi:unnamed protein product [Rotaria socialis]|uniref:Uncharacterized protein n=1 Tax=Rotaria socialis TaxID=392032 RepID=A0A819CAJ3_9BILA|nr:unnamed protein product [Rotaria socialis]CAF4659700.1 unnamed protein product [Rotaria socialis]
MWMNQLPAQFNGCLLQLDEGTSLSFENIDFDTVQYRSSVLAIEILEKTLRSFTNSNLFPQKHVTNSYLTYTKLLCSYNDKFISFTNCLPIDNLERIPFNITTDFKRAQAVDNDTRTCWKIHRSIRSADLFAIDFQTIQINRALSFSIGYLHQKPIQTKLQISISLDCQTWIEFGQQNQSGVIYDEKNLVICHTGLFPTGFQVFRFIKFVSLEGTKIFE